MKSDGKNILPKLHGALLKNEQDAVSLLLGEKAIKEEHQLDKNITDLKTLIDKILRGESYLSQYSGAKVGIFGTRQLSLTVARALSQFATTPMCFLVSDIAKLEEIEGIPIFCLNSLKDLSLDILVNCIEGIHEDEISMSLVQIDNAVNVISWRDL